MPVWDLATQGNWNLILAETRIAERQPTNIRRDSIYEYYPIQPIYSTPNSHTLLIGTQSNSAQPYWFLGARASQFLYVSPSMTSAFISGVQASETKKIGLNRLTLVEFKNYDVSPYTLQLDIPYWLEDIYVEVWEYLGTEENDNYQAQLADIQDSLNRIEANSGTNTGNDNWGT